MDNRSFDYMRHSEKDVSAGLAKSLLTFFALAIVVVMVFAFIKFTA